MAYRPKRSKACVMPETPEFYPIGNKTKVKQNADIIHPRDCLPRNGDVCMCEVTKITDGEGVYVILFTENVENNFEAFIPTDELSLIRKTKIKREGALFSKKQVMISIGDQFPVVLMKVDKKSTGELYIDASKVEVEQIGTDRVEYCRKKHAYDQPLRILVKEVANAIRKNELNSISIIDRELSAEIYREAIWPMEDIYQKAVFIFMRTLHDPDILITALEFPAKKEERSKILVQSSLLVFKKYTKLIDKIKDLTLKGIQYAANKDLIPFNRVQDKIKEMLEASHSKVKLCCGSTVLNCLLTNSAQKIISLNIEDHVQQRRQMIETVCTTLKPWQSILSWLFEEDKIHAIYSIEEVCRTPGSEGQLCKSLFHRILYILYQDLDLIDDQQLDLWAWSRENSSLRWCKELELKAHEMLVRLNIREQRSPLQRAD